MNAPLPFTQHIRPAKLGVLLALIACVEGAAGVANNLLDGPISATLLLAGMMLLFAWLAGAFWELRLVVQPDALELGWAPPFRTRIAVHDIAAVSVADYPARRFLGWGWRGAAGGDWAFSDIGAPRALVIRRHNGKSVYVTLPDAEAALAAVADCLKPAQAPAQPALATPSS